MQDFISTLIFICVFTLKTTAQYIPNQSTPRQTLEEVFRCARTGDYSNIHFLCDPEKRNDGDTKRICEIATSSKIEKEEFQRFFKLAYSIKETIIREKAATVTFKFGPKAQQKETMRLVKSNNKWYLSRF